MAVFQNTHGLNTGTGCDLHILEQAMRPNLNPLAQRYIAFKDTPYVDKHVLPSVQHATQIKSVGVGQLNPLL